MHLIVHFTNGKAFEFLESWATFSQKYLRQGLFYFDGQTPGRLSVLNLAFAEQFSDDEWDAMQKANEKQKKANEEQQKAATEKAEADRKESVRKQAQGLIDYWNKQSWFKKLGRKCPYKLPEE